MDPLAWILPLSLQGARQWAVERAAMESTSRKDASRILGVSEKQAWSLMRKYRVRARWMR